eukprot:scaffold5439_cov132-Cylindrotheca_fusiformis.AAC.6
MQFWSITQNKFSSFSTLQMNQIVLKNHVAMKNTPLSEVESGFHQEDAFDTESYRNNGRNSSVGDTTGSTGGKEARSGGAKVRTVNQLTARLAHELKILANQPFLLLV